MKRCPHCRRCLRPMAFYANRARKDGLSVQCRTCHDRAVRRWRAAHAGRVAASARHRYDAWASRLRLEAILRGGGCCQMCGTRDIPLIRPMTPIRPHMLLRLRILSRLKQQAWPAGTFVVLCANCRLGSASGRVGQG